MLSIRPQIAKVAKPRSFTYLPRYYDERKEKINELERKIRKEENNEENGNKKVHEFHFRNAINERWRGVEYKNAVSRSNMIIILLIITISFIGYYLFKKFDMIELWMQHKN